MDHTLRCSRAVLAVIVGATLIRFQGEHMAMNLPTQTCTFRSVRKVHTSIQKKEEHTYNLIHQSDT